MTLEQFILIASILLLVSIFASKAMGRYGVPVLLIFMAIGMLAGSEGPGGLYFDDFAAAQALGVVALIFILFSGGLDTEWSEVRPTLGAALLLVTFGVAITAIMVGLFADLVLGFSLLDGLLLGAIVSSTDAAAVFAIMRSKGISLRGHIKPLIELESASNDPMAIFLTTALIGLIISAGESVLGLVPMFVQQMLLGGALGYVFGRLAVMLLNRIDLEYEGLYSVLSVAVMLIAFSATHLLGGNGFLAIFLTGLVLANSDFIHKRSLLRFHDGMAWLMQIAMFLTLGLLVFPSEVYNIMGQGLLLSLFLIFVARPISVFLCLLPVRLAWRDKVMVGWVGLRGAVPIVLATFPLIAGVPTAGTIFNLVFFIVLTSVLIQGTSIPIVARWLGVDAPIKRRPRPPLEFEPTDAVSGDLVEVEVPPDSAVIGKQIVDIGLPGGILFVLIGRGEAFVVPVGSTVIEAGDHIMMLADDEQLSRVQAILEVTTHAEKPEIQKLDDLV